MTIEEIKARLKEKRLSQRRIARRFKTSQSAVHLLVHRRLNSERLEKRFAHLLDVPIEEIRTQNHQMAG